jgi:hypothetical protein
MDSFKESANRPDVRGDDARHARRPGQPQHKRMEIAEGRAVIGRDGLLDTSKESFHASTV